MEKVENNKSQKEFFIRRENKANFGKKGLGLYLKNLILGMHFLQDF